MKAMMDNEMETVTGGAANGTLYYRIAKGDTLGEIAKKYGTTVNKLMALNPQIKDPNKIYAGDSIRIQ